MNPSRRRLLGHLLVVASCAVVVATPAASAGYPDKPIRLVVPFPPGGPTDMVARPLAQFLGERLKQQVIVDNRGGAGGSIGAELVAKAPADGYTLIMATVGTHAINKSLYKHLPYDPVKDFTPITLVAAAPVALVANPKVPVNSVADVIALAKSKPGSLNFGSAGNGTPGHLTGEMFCTATGVKLGHVPYKGSAPAVADLLGGQTQLMFDPLQSVLPQVRAGRLKLLALSSKSRSPAAPNVPTFAEAGVKDFETTAWWGIFAPANLPPDIVKRLNTEINAVIASKGFQDLLVPQGVTVMGDTPEEFAKFQQAEIAKWGKAVHDSGASID
ncbi:MAG TPA: tripartite tricarboxylate transporter substrate binding protein [Casimicrobiaceae bacterium]|nr:tripartite tricarboxylate transporter substrate binding protein [Casimicrobiaceae bacterium]